MKRQVTLITDDREFEILEAAVKFAHNLVKWLTNTEPWAGLRNLDIKDRLEAAGISLTHELEEDLRKLLEGLETEQ